METRWGKRFGRYEIISEIGRGAMGVVYKARDPKIDRFVAVKAISLSGQNPEEEREYRHRFFQEAQAAGRLLHPGIVAIFDTGEEPENHVAYIVMEYIAGQSLDRLLSGNSKKLSLNTALLLAAELAEGLDHAHAQGVVHRDMKPANILVTKEGHAKIADFGIAKLDLANRTLPGEALGTPAYMSPEQLEGEPVDGRSDLFSLGAILYRMVTGYGPFQGNSAATVCFKVANRDPLRATSFDYDLPPELDAIIARAMAKDAAQRYQRGLEFALDLKQLRERGQAEPKGANNALRFARTEEVITWSGSRLTTGGAGRRADSKTPIQAIIRRALAPVSFHASSWWRMPVVRVGTVAAVATVIMSFFAYYHGHRVRSSTQSSSLPAVASVIEKPLAAASEPPVAAQSAAKRPDSTTLRAAKNLEIPAKPVADSTLDIRIEHHFPEADLSLWIDDKLAYDHSLRGQTKKHWNPFRENVKETETVQLPTGPHLLRVRVRSAPEKYEQSATIGGSFVKDHPAVLQISFDKRAQGLQLVLR